jgi:aspartyl-tRNA(Asn)/glutamyl-tRNA(Gln) amidotransferase subunit A
VLETITQLPLTEVVEQLSRGALSPVDVMRATLHRMERSKELNVFVAAAEPDKLLAQASAAEERWHRGSNVGVMDGVPITVKDAIVTEEWPTLVGSLTVDPQHSLREDAPAVARLREEGALLLGKTTTSRIHR